MLCRLLIFLFAFCLVAEEPSKKVVCVTIPKAGTHLLKKVIQQIAGKRPPWLIFEEKFLSSNENIYIAHLFPAINSLRTFRPDRVTKILLIRDPRDILISFAHHLVNKKWPFRLDKMNYDAKALKALSWDDKLKTAMLFPPNTPQDSFPCVKEWLQDPNIIVIRFEDLIGPRGGGSLEAQRRIYLTLATHLG
ncbi:MAG: sulfotransferase domain-containing protein, partial [Verrucomicrobiota bacterium]|nr:sulfotransferase domain-containing protein [Verrucomicrobiota bacterium]